MKIRNILILAILGIAISSQAQDYKSAIGLRAAWGWGLTGKFFIKEHHAIEGILRYRSYGVPGYDYNYLSVTGLYQVHNNLENVTPGLFWYYGGGAFVGFYGGDFDDYYTGDESATYIGLALCLGLDYKFETAPINLSLDWMPAFVLTGYGNGFAGEGGGFAIRYTF
jgi:hypothetical protein